MNRAGRQGKTHATIDRLLRSSYTAALSLQEGTFDWEIRISTNFSELIDYDKDTIGMHANKPPGIVWVLLPLVPWQASDLRPTRVMA